MGVYGDLPLKLSSSSPLIGLQGSVVRRLGQRRRVAQSLAQSCQQGAAGTALCLKTPGVLSGSSNTLAAALLLIAVVSFQFQYGCR